MMRAAAGEAKNSTAAPMSRGSHTPKQRRPSGAGAVRLAPRFSRGGPKKSWMAAKLSRLYGQ